MNLLSVLPVILYVLPGIIQGVEAASQGATGADKKAAVLSVVAQMVGVAKAMDPADAALIDFSAKLAGPIVDALVATYNIAGKFFHKPAVATA